MDLRFQSSLFEQRVHDATLACLAASDGIQILGPDGAPTLKSAFQSDEESHQNQTMKAPFEFERQNRRNSPSEDDSTKHGPSSGPTDEDPRLATHEDVLPSDLALYRSQRVSWQNHLQKRPSRVLLCQ